MASGRGGDLHRRYQGESRFTFILWGSHSHQSCSPGQSVVYQRQGQFRKCQGGESGRDERDKDLEKFNYRRGEGKPFSVFVILAP